MKGLQEESLHRIFQSSFVQRKGILGPGADCALLTPPAGCRLLQTVDQLIGGIHLDSQVSPQVYARKLLRRTLSDLAAAGATPWAISWTLAVPKTWGAAKVKALARAFLKEAEHFDVSVVGGDCSQASQVVLTCTALGLANGPVPGRSGAQPGDRILVSGVLGNAVRSGAHLLPEPRLSAGKRLVKKHSPHAMMDLSDGLGKDLPRILHASAVGAEVNLQDLPLRAGLQHNRAGWESAVAEGEDYELLVVLSPKRAVAVLEDRQLQEVGFRAIGVICSGSSLRWLERGQARRFARKGWEYQWD